jgi:hypothetical protein
MQQFPPRELLEPQYFLPSFAALWFGITALLAVVGGWRSLAQTFEAREDLQGKRFRFVSGSLGMRLLPVSYGGCLFVTVGDAGFRLSILFLFRLLSPPLYFPWTQVESVESKRFWLIRATVIRFRNHWPLLALRGPAGESVRSAFAAAKGRDAP